MSVVVRMSMGVRMDLSLNLRLDLGLSLSLDLDLVNLNLAEILFVLVIVELQTSFAAALDPLESNVTTAIDFALEFGILGANLSNSVVGSHVDGLTTGGHGLVVGLELPDVLDGALQDGTLCFLASRNHLGNLVDALVDGLATATLN